MEGFVLNKKMLIAAGIGCAVAMVGVVVIRHNKKKKVAAAQKEPNDIPEQDEEVSED